MNLTAQGITRNDVAIEHVCYLLESVLAEHDTFSKEAMAKLFVMKWGEFVAGRKHIVDVDSGTIQWSSSRAMVITD